MYEYSESLKSQGGGGAQNFQGGEGISASKKTPDCMYTT